MNTEDLIAPLNLDSTKTPTNDMLRNQVISPDDKLILEPSPPSTIVLEAKVDSSSQSKAVENTSPIKPDSSTTQTMIPNTIPLDSSKATQPADVLVKDLVKPNDADATSLELSSSLNVPKSESKTENNSHNEHLSTSNPSHFNNLLEAVINSSSYSVIVKDSNQYSKIINNVNEDIPSDIKNAPLRESQEVKDKQTLSSGENQIDSKSLHVEPVKISRFLVSPVIPKASIVDKVDSIPEKAAEINSKAEIEKPPEEVKPPEVKKFSKFKVSKVNEDTLRVSHAKMNGDVHKHVASVESGTSEKANDPLNTSPNIITFSENQRRPTPSLTPQASQINNIASQLRQADLQNYLNSQNISNLNTQMINYQLQANQLAAEQLQPNYMAPLQVSISNQLPFPNQMAALNITTNQLMAASLGTVSSDQSIGIGQTPMMTNENISRILLRGYCFHS